MNDLTNHQEAILKNQLKVAIKESGLTYEALGSKLGYESPKHEISRFLNGHRGKLPKQLVDILDELGYELKIVKKEP